MPPYPTSPGKEKSDVNIITVPSPVPPQPTTPATYPYYQPPKSGPTQQNTSDQADKISKLKSRKEKLVNQVEELQNELREANYENSLLQKQCREYELQISRLNDALEREKELSAELKNLARDEKNYNSKLKDELERENKKVIFFYLFKALFVSVLLKSCISDHLMKGHPIEGLKTVVKFPKEPARSFPPCNIIILGEPMFDCRNK